MIRVYINGEKTGYDFSQYREFPASQKQAALEFNSRRGYSLEDLTPKEDVS